MIDININHICLLLFLALGSFSLLQGQSGSTQIIYVDSSAIGANTGDSWGNAFTDLQDALSYGRSLNDTIIPEIWVAKGTYFPNLTNRDSSFSMFHNLRLYGGFDGMEINKGERIVGADSLFVNETILSGDIGVAGDSSDNSLHVLRADFPVSDFGDPDSFFINGLIISDGREDSLDFSGGGLDILNARAIISSCKFSRNFASVGAGLRAKNAEVFISSSLFENNNSPSSGGGLLFEDCKAIVRECIFIDNFAETFGGGLFAIGGKITIIGSQFFNNRTEEDGGGAFIWRNTLELRNNLFSNNFAKERGGGLSARADSIKMSDCTFEKNRTDIDGGAVYFRNSRGLIRNSVFTENYSNQLGGGVTSEGGTLTFVKSSFIGNNGRIAGGGLFITGSNPIVDSCLFQRDSSSTGGGIHVRAFSNPIIKNSIFTDCYSYGEGGGLYTFDFCDPYIYGSAFINNQAVQNGGAIFNTAANPEFVNCLFRNNEGGDSGAILDENGSTSSYDLCLFQDNHSSANGGGILAIRFCDIQISRSAFIGNSADNNGGGYFNADSCRAEITNSTFALNKAQVSGGGLYLKGDTAFLTGNTLRENEALTAGAGLFNNNNNSTQLASNLIGENYLVDSQGNIGLASNLAGNHGSASFQSLGHNFISNDQNSFIVPSIGDQIGDDQQPLDPMVKALGFYGGPRNRLQLDTFDIEWFLPTYATEAGSPLLDAGPTPDESSLRTDQRGYSRLIGGEEQNIDIGAYESQTGFLESSVESLCSEDDFYKRLNRIVLRDSTGGGFEYGEDQTLTLRLSDGLIFNLSSNPAVECEGAGLSDCNLSFDSQELTVEFDRSFDTTLNTISIVGLEVRAEEESEADDYFLLRSGGNAELNGLALEDSVTYALIYALPNYHIADQPYDNAFDEDDGFWLPDGDFSIWEHGEPAGEIIINTASGEASWMTNLSERYPANDTSWLASPCFDLTGVEAPLITFNKWVDTQPGLDGVVFQQSTDRGSNWTTVGDNQQAEGLGWYNANSIVANPANQQAGQQYGWTGREEGWGESRIILLDQDPDALVRFRFAFASIPVVDESIPNDGFAFDDFFVGQGGQRKALVEQFVGGEINDSPSRLDSIVTNNDFLVPIKYALESDFYDINPVGPSVRSFHYGVSEPGFSVLQGEQYFGPTVDLPEAEFILALSRNPRMFIEIDTTSEPSVSIRSTRNLPNEVNVYFAIVERLENQQAVFRTFLYSPAGIPVYDWQENAIYDYNPTWDESSVDPGILSEYENAELVVFVQDRFTKEVFQVGTSPLWSGLLDPGALREGGFAERLDPELRIYPNPANYELNLDFGQVMEDDLQVRLTDMQGRPVQQRSLNPGKAFYKVDLQKLSAGMYYLELYNRENSIHRQKIVVRH